MVKTPATLESAPLLPRPPVEVDPGLVVVTVKLEIRELAELMTEEREESEEESPGDVTVVVRDDSEDDELEDDEPPPKVEVGGEVDVIEGTTGIEVGLDKQTVELPELTVIGGVGLPTPLESESMITTVVPEAIDTLSQVNEVPVTPVKAARMEPLAPPSWKD